MRSSVRIAPIIAGAIRSEQPHFLRPAKSGSCVLSDGNENIGEALNAPGP